MYIPFIYIHYKGFRYSIKGGMSLSPKFLWPLYPGRYSNLWPLCGTSMPGTLRGETMPRLKRLEIDEKSHR